MWYISFRCNLQWWATLSVWFISTDHIGWVPAWRTWLLVELWEPLVNREGSCIISCEGLKLLTLPDLLSWFLGCWSYYLSLSKMSASVLLLAMLFNNKFYGTVEEEGIQGQTIKVWIPGETVSWWFHYYIQDYSTSLMYILVLAGSFLIRKL